MEEDYNNYPLVLDDVIYMSEDINPHAFKYALSYEEIFPLEANFIKSLLGNMDILSYLVNEIQEMFNNHDINDWVISKEDLKENHPMIIIFLLYYQPQIFQYIVKKIYNMNYDIVKPKLGDFLDFIKKNG